MNLNDVVRFRLTAEGRLAVHDYFDGLKLRMHAKDWFAHHKQEDGSFCDMLWSVMQILGPSIFMGGPPLIEKNELVLESDLEESIRESP